jgi:tricorn protease
MRGPVVNWFDQSNDDAKANYSIYMATLQKETISPLAKESDEEKIKEPADTAKAKKETTTKDKSSIDWDGIENRILNIPVSAGSYSNLGMGKQDELLYISYDADGNQAMLHKFDLKNRKDNEVMNMAGFVLSADGKKNAICK